MRGGYRYGYGSNVKKTRSKVSRKSRRVAGKRSKTTRRKRSKSRR